MKSVSDICLGTTKLGIPDYGFSSSEIRPDFNSLEFLKQVGELGINKFDTSPRYGQSEKILGNYIKQKKEVPFISSKIDNLKPNDPDSDKCMINSVKTSLRQMNLCYLDLCYLHQNEMEIISDPYVQEGLEKLKDIGLIKKSGASVYSEEECEYALQGNRYDYIQVPVSVFDLNFYQKFIQNNTNKNIVYTNDR